MTAWFFLTCSCGTIIQKLFMKFHYHQDTDSLYIDLSANPSVDSLEVSPGIVIDYDAKGNIVGIDIDNASKKVDLSSFETSTLPRQD